MTDRTAAPTSRRIWGLVLAPVAAVATWLVAEGIFDVAFEVETGAGETQAMSSVAVLIGSLVISLLGWVTALVLARFASRPRRWWISLAFVVYALSWVAVFVQTVDADTRDRTAILVVHSVVAFVLMATVAPTLPDRRKREASPETATTPDVT